MASLWCLAGLYQCARALILLLGRGTVSMHTRGIYGKERSGQRDLVACLLDAGVRFVRFSAGCIRRSCVSYWVRGTPTPALMQARSRFPSLAVLPCCWVARVSAQSVGGARVGAPRSCQLPLSLRAHQAAPRHQGCVNRQLSSPSSIPFTTAPPTAALLHSRPRRRARHDAPHRASRARAKRFLRTRCRRSVRKRCKRSHL